MFGSVMVNVPNNHPTLVSLLEQTIDHLGHKIGGSVSIKLFAEESISKLSSLDLNHNNKKQSQISR